MMLLQGRKVIIPNTVRAVNKFKNKYLSGGNKGDNEGKFGDTTWLYLKDKLL